MWYDFINSNTFLEIFICRLVYVHIFLRIAWLWWIQFHRNFCNVLDLPHGASDVYRRTWQSFCCWWWRWYCSCSVSASAASSTTVQANNLIANTRMYKRCLHTIGSLRQLTWAPAKLSKGWEQNREHWQKVVLNQNVCVFLSLTLCVDSFEGYVFDASAEGMGSSFRVFCTKTTYDVIIFKFQVMGQL